MAMHDPITAVLAEEDFRVNGCSVLKCNQADDYLYRAHAVLTFVQAAADDAGGFGKLVVNQQIVSTALSAAGMLLEMGLWQLHHDGKALAA